MQVTSGKISLFDTTHELSVFLMRGDSEQSVGKTRPLPQDPQTSNAVARYRTQTGEQCPNQFSEAAATASNSWHILINH